MGVLLSHRMILQSTIYRLLGKYLAAIARALVCVLFGAALGAVVATAVVLVFWSVIDCRCFSRPAKKVLTRFSRFA